MADANLSMAWYHLGGGLVDHFCKFDYFVKSNPILWTVIYLVG